MKRHFEFWLIAFVLLCLFLLYGRMQFATALTVAALGMLGLYYLLSGTLVLFDNRVNRSLRLAYGIGLWALGMGMAGLIYTFHFWKNSRFLLMIAVGFSIAVLILLLISYYFLPVENKSSNGRQYVPILSRLLIYLPVFLLFIFIPNRTLYHYFGPFRDNDKYIDRLIDALDHPGDSTKAYQLELIEQKLNEEHDHTRNPKSN